MEAPIPIRQSLLNRLMYIFRNRRPQASEPRGDPETSSPPFAPPPYVEEGPHVLPFQGKEKHHCPAEPSQAQNGGIPQKQPAPTILQPYGDRVDAGTSRSKVAQSMGMVRSLGATSSTQWARYNPVENVDRMRDFLYHWLTLEYSVTPSSILTSADRTHFICLSRLLFCLVPYQNLHGWATTEQELKGEVWGYVRENLKAPLQTLGVDESHVIQLLHFFFQFEDIRASNGVNSHVHEHFAEQGWFEMLRSNISGDLRLVDAVIPLYDHKAKDSLLKAIRRTQSLYFASIDYGSQAFRPSYQLTRYAKMKLCPCCRN